MYVVSVGVRLVLPAPAGDGGVLAVGPVEGVLLVGLLAVELPQRPVARHGVGALGKVVVAADQEVAIDTCFSRAYALREM